MLSKRSARPHKPAFSDLEKERLRLLCAERKNLDEMVADLGRSQATVIRWAKKLELDYIRRTGNQYTVAQ